MKKMRSKIVLLSCLVLAMICFMRIDNLSSYIVDDLNNHQDEILILALPDAISSIDTQLFEERSGKQVGTITIVDDDVQELYKMISSTTFVEKPEMVLIDLGILMLPTKEINNVNLYNQSKNQLINQYQGKDIEVNLDKKLYQIRKEKNFDEEIEYLKSIIKVLKDQEIEVSIFRTPIAQFIESKESYRTIYYDAFKKELSKEILYLDYNILGPSLKIDSQDVEVGNVSEETKKLVTEHMVTVLEGRKNLISTQELIINPVFHANKGRGEIRPIEDSKYGQGMQIEKIYDKTNYNSIASISQENILQNSKDNQGYEFSVVVKNIDNISLDILKEILTIYSDVEGVADLQHRGITHIEEDYYEVSVELICNMGSYYDLRINSMLPKGKKVEIYRPVFKKLLVGSI